MLGPANDKLVASLLLVERPGAPSSVLARSSIFVQRQPAAVPASIVAAPIGGTRGGCNCLLHASDNLLQVPCSVIYGILFHLPAQDKWSGMMVFRLHTLHHSTTYSSSVTPSMRCNT